MSEDKIGGEKAILEERRKKLENLSKNTNNKKNSKTWGKLRFVHECGREESKSRSE